MTRLLTRKLLLAGCVSALGTGCAHNVIQSRYVQECPAPQLPAPTDAPAPPSAAGTDPTPAPRPNSRPACEASVPIGLAYALPKGQVLLAAFRKPITTADATKSQTDYATAQAGVADATTKLAAAHATQTKNATLGETDAQKSQDKSAVDAATATLAAAQALADAAKQSFADLKSGLPRTSAAELQAARDALDAASGRVEADNTALDDPATKQDTAKLAAAQKKLAKDQTDLKQKQKTAADALAGSQTGKYVETFALTPQAIVPDHTQRYVASLDHSQWRDDTVKLSVVNGLLTSTNLQSADQTGNIIASLASVAVGVVTFAGAGIPIVPSASSNKAERPAATAVPPPHHCDYVFAGVFDPANAAEVQAINDALNKDEVQAHIKLQSTNYTHSAVVHPLEAARAQLLDGLVYRTAAGVGVSVEPNRDSATWDNCPLQTTPASQAVQVFVPDTNAEYIAPTDAGALTSSGFQFNFTSGMLADYGLTRPSEIAAGMAIPVDIVNKIMTIPTSILKLRLDYSTAQTNLATQNAALISAQGSESVALLNAKTALETAETNLTTADINDPTARYKALTAMVQARQSLADAITAAAKSSTVVTQPASHP